MARSLLFFALVLFPLWTFGADDDPKTKQTVALSQPVYEGLKKAQELIEARQYAQGHAELDKLRARRDSLSSYERAQIWNLSAYTFYLQEEYRRAIEAYGKVLEQQELPAALEQSTLKTLSQLYFTIEQYALALSTVERLLAIIGEPSPDLLMLKGQAHFQLEQYRAALEPIRTAIAKYREQGKSPQENWLLLLRVCYFELDDFKSMIGVLEELIALYPKTQYVLTLAGVYSELGDTAKQLALSEALYEAGHLEEPSQIVNLANLYLAHGVPYKAAKLLDDELTNDRVTVSERNLRLLSQAWYQAREDARAIAPLARAAAMSEDGELYVRLAQSYINLERWDDAVEALRQGLDKGGIKRVGTAHIMRGMALFNQRKLDAARAAFADAAADRRSAASARQWMAYVDSELTRDRTLDQVVPERSSRQQDKILENL